MSETKQDLRPSARASEEVWDEYLSANAVVWNFDFSCYNVATSVSIATNKDAKIVEVYIEFNGDSGLNPEIHLEAFVYNAQKRIIGRGGVFVEENIDGLLIKVIAIAIKYPISKIDKIVICGKIWG